MTLEYTDNVSLQCPIPDLLRRVHAVLVEVAGVRLDNCKTRAVVVRDYCVGDGATDGAFVHLDVRLLEGRSAERKAEVGRQLLAMLRQAVLSENEGPAVQLTVALADIRRSAYFKYPEGTL